MKAKRERERVDVYRSDRSHDFVFNFVLFLVLKI